MRAPNVENQIMQLGSDASTIYFQAKDSLIDARDSRSEQFFAAARIVRAFWKIVLHSQTPAGLNTRKRRFLNCPPRRFPI
jgi:hypothetical protein